MKSTLLICAIILVASELRQGVAAWKPTMFPARDVLQIQEGDELRIECKGEGKIQFSTEIITGNAVQQSAFNISFDSNSGTYTFVRPSAIRADTGWYACAREDIKIRNDEQVMDHESEDISWIYVYVNSSDPFAVMEALYETITMLAGGDAVVPCRPTSPDLPVILEINDGAAPEPENMTYDPRIGFILRDVGREHSGETLTCKLNGIHESTTWPFYFAHVAVKKPLAPPVINQDTLHHVTWGQDLTLECLITVEIGARFTLNWTIPNSVPQERLVYGQHLIGVEHKPEEATWKINMTLKNVQKSDEGQYTCTATGVSDTRTHSSTFITTWDPEYTYVNATVEGDPTLTLPEGQDAQWRVLIDTYPEEFTVEWFKEGSDTPIISTDVDKKSRYTHEHLGGMDHIFNIFPLRIDDSGRYTIHVFTSQNSTILTLPLTVVGKPIVQMEGILPYYPPGQNTIFTSHIIGSPLPNVTWSYVEYPNFPLKDNAEPIPLSNFRNVRDERGPYGLTSRLNITINMTGDVICRSCNEINCTENTQQILVSDVAGAFGVRNPGLVTEGDDISLTCGASVYNYSGTISWKSKDSEELDMSSDRIRITKLTTKFTFQSILHIPKVKKSDSGEYLCEALNGEGQPDSEQFKLSVADARAPQFDYTNLNNSEIRIELPKDKNKAVTLECRAHGRPVPKITWYKNGELLKVSKQYILSDRNTTLQIGFFSDAETDRGRYLCNATNRISSATRYVDIKIAGKSDNTTIWISLICVLIVIIIIVITYMGFKLQRERRVKRELCEAGLTHFEKGALECLNPDLTVDDQAELLPYDKKWEFPRELLKLGKQLGSGAFGVVMKAEARGICVEGEVTTVAVKMVRRSADPSYMKALSSELKIMIHLGRHLNVVNLLGACTKTILTKRELYVIVEYCRYGNLHNYLQRHRASFIDQIDPSTQKIDPNIGMDRLVRSESVGSQNRLKYVALSFSRSVSVKSSDSNSGAELVDYRQGADFGDINMSPDGGVLSNNSVQPGWRSNYRGDYKDQNLKPISTHDLLCWAWQVARGMEYLSSRNVLHGDLAARNILLADDNIVKICDFGLAKNMYKDNNYKKKGDGPLPIKWMAVESIRDRIFSTQSDVWSYGIVLWEFFTLARTPYPGMEAEKQYDKLIEGYRMEKPEYATDEIYDFMLHCWKAKPSLRPSFPELTEKIGVLLNESIKMYYLDLNTPYLEMNTTALQNGQSDYLTMMSSPNHDYHNSPDPTSQTRPDSAYLSMSPLEKTSEPGIFSPRPELEESHFSFPPPNKNTPINSDSEDCIESAPMLTPEDPYMKPIDVQQRRAEFVNQSKEETPVERDSGYCNLPSKMHRSNSENENSENVQNIERNLSADKLQKINNKINPSIISGNDNYVNMPQQKADRLKDPVDSFSNPSYVIMSKLEEGRQFA